MISKFSKRKSKLVLTAFICTLASAPLYMNLPQALQAPLVKQISADEIKQTIYDVKTKEKTDIYLVSKTMSIKSDEDGSKSFEKGQYVALTKRMSIPDTKSKITSGIDSIVKVPEKLDSSFSIKIEGTYTGKPIKFYAAPDTRTELNTMLREDEINTNDLSIYNGHFLKVSVDGHPMYVDTNSINWAVHAKDNLKIIGIGDETQVIKNEKNFTTDVSSRTNFTYEDLVKITAGTGLEGIELAAIQAEEKYSVNSLFILSLAAHESGWGTSPLARNRNNLFGICAYDTNTDAASYFSTRSECVDYFGRLISKEYFAKGRKNLWSINEIYASDTTWASKVNDTMLSMLNKIRG